MRSRRFRPALDHLCPRIAPTSIASLPVPASTTGTYVSTSDDPVMMVDISGTIDYSSDDSSANTLDAAPVSSGM